MHNSRMKINAQRLHADLAELAAISEPGAGVTRTFPSDAYVRQRGWLRAKFAAAGLRTWSDAAGNVFGTHAPAENNTAPLWLGSHTDTVHGGGHLDGALGVMAALEVARTLHEHGATLQHPVWVCDYLAEEANDFGVSCVGSRSLNGTFKPEFLTRSAAGQTLAEAVCAVGGKAEKIASAGMHAAGNRVPHACLELHIEQGLRLLDAGAQLAVVTGIVGIRRGVFEFHGRADHAGSTPMHTRQDALTAAAMAIVHLRALCEGEPRAVGTVGRLEVFPNFANVIPELARLTAEVRSLDVAVIDEIWREWLAGIQEGDKKFLTRTTQLSETNAAAAKPVPALFDTVLAACHALDPRAQSLSSGAGHDTQHLSLFAPSCMIFVPSIGGRSHCPEEATAPEHLALGCQALLEAAQRVDRITQWPMP